MRAGADVIFQATFFDGHWRGHADFLYRTERPSPSSALQLRHRRHEAFARRQSRRHHPDVRLRRPARATPGDQAGDGLRGDGRRRRASPSTPGLRRVLPPCQDSVRGAGAGRLAGDRTYPDPVDHCRVCVWYPTCIQRRRDDDHPSIVAGMRRVDTERFIEGSVPTLTAIAELPRDAWSRTSARERCDVSATRPGSSSTSA